MIDAAALHTAHPVIVAMNIVAHPISQLQAISHHLASFPKSLHGLPYQENPAPAS
jgi:hypothetical protein